MIRCTSYRNLIFLVVCFFCGGSLHAGNPPKFTHLSVVDGLSQNSVWSILHDKQGFLWFGTDDGLNKYDGYSFHVYRHKTNDSTTISQNTIHALLQDRVGNIWIGTSGELNVYDPVKDKFHVVPVEGLVSREQATVVTSALVQDAKGNIWIGTRFGGLIRLNTDGKTSKRFFPSTGDSSGLASNSIRALYVDKSGTLWVGTEGGGIQRYIERSESFQSYYTKPQKGETARGAIIASFFEDSKGRFWVGTMEDGLMLLDRTTGAATFYSKHQPASDGRMDTLSVLAISEDKHGHILCATFGSGLKAFTPETGEMQVWKNDLSDPHSLSSNFILSIYPDETGSLWIGTYTNGISMYDPEGEHFQVYKNEIPRLTQFTDNNIRSIYKDRKGYLWLGTGKGLNIFDPSTGACKQFRSDVRDPSSISDNYVSSLLEDSKGTMWIGTRKGVDTFNRTTNRFIRCTDEKKYPRAITRAIIRAMIEDKFGIIWFGTPMGLVSYDPRLQQFKTYEHNSHDSSSLSSENIRSLFQDHAGTLWVGTYGGGIDKFDRSTGKFKAYMHDANNRNSLCSNLASPIVEDQKGYLWVGTYGGGVNKFDPGTEKFTVYTENDGLSNNTVFGIQIDEKGNVWIATLRGISRLNPAGNTFRTYTIASGLQGEEFNLNSSFKDEEGTIYFGGNFGFNSFRPHLIRDNTFIPPVYVTSMSIFNKPVHLDSSITMKQLIELPYDENSIAFDFVALSFRKPELNQYKYMLEGFDQEWIAAGTTRKASYTNLHPGTYVFRVIGSNNDGVWNPTGRAISIIVKPPFWRTWWAYLFYVVGITGIITCGFFYLQHRQRKRLMLEQQRTEAEVVRQKNIKLKEANDEILRQQEILRQRNDQIEKTNLELKHEIEQREALVSELKMALENVKTLGGLIPICSSCKKIRDDEGYWNILEAYLAKHSDAKFSHGICPDCAKKLYPEYAFKHPGIQPDSDE